MAVVKQKMLLAQACILTNALVWGLMWFPFRTLEADGVSNFTTSLVIYLIATVLGVGLFWNTFRQQFHFRGLLVGLMLIYGWTNFSYTWALAEGQVMRVLLLFYLSPLWTVLFARIILKEHLTRSGKAVVGLSLVGCVVVLYRPGIFDGDLPLSSLYEWLALSGGIAFALGSVISRKASAIPVAVKSATIWLGVVFFGFLGLLMKGQLHQVLHVPLEGWLIFVSLAVTLLSVSVVSQYGVTVLPASQAMTLMLTELVIAAVSAYYLAGETLSVQEWVGGGIIILASLMSGDMTYKPNSAK